MLGPWPDSCVGGGSGGSGGSGWGRGRECSGGWQNRTDRSGRDPVGRRRTGRFRRAAARRGNGAVGRGSKRCYWIPCSWTPRRRSAPARRRPAPAAWALGTVARLASLGRKTGSRDAAPCYHRHRQHCKPPDGLKRRSTRNGQRVVGRPRPEYSVLLCECSRLTSTAVLNVCVSRHLPDCSCDLFL